MNRNTIHRLRRPPTWDEWLTMLSTAQRAEVSPYPPGSCCAQRTDEGPRGHYRVIGWLKDPLGGLATELVHGADSFLPGMAVRGVYPDTLVPCGCGKWEPATREQGIAAWESIPQDRRRILESRRVDAREDGNAEEFERLSGLLADEAFMNSRPPHPFGGGSGGEGGGPEVTDP